MQVEGFSELDVPMKRSHPFSYRNHNGQSRNITGTRRSWGYQRGREPRPHPPKERIGYIPDHAGRRWWQNHQCQHRTWRRWTGTQKAEERFAGNRPLHHLWQPNRLSAISNNHSGSWQSSKVHGSDTGHGARSEQAYLCASDPWSIYLFISDKTSQGVKLLLRASEATSDVSIWSSRCPVNQIDCLLTTVMGKTGTHCCSGARWKKKKEEENLHMWNCTALVAMRRRSVMVRLCAYVSKSTIICTTQSCYKKEQNLSLFVHFFEFRKPEKNPMFEMKFLSRTSDLFSKISHIQPQANSQSH